MYNAKCDAMIMKIFTNSSLNTEPALKPGNSEWGIEGRNRPAEL